MAPMTSGWRCTHPWQELSRPSNWIISGLLGLLLLLSLGVSPSATAAQASDCTPGLTVACPIRFGEPVRATLTDPLDLHAWHLHVLNPASMHLVLTDLPADYDVRIVGPDGEKLAEPRKSGTADEVVEISWAGPGVYVIFVNSLAGETSNRPYSLTVTGQSFGASFADVSPALDGVWRVLVDARGGDPGQLHEPKGLAVDEQGNIYVAESNNQRVQKFSPSGASLAVWGSRGPGLGQFKAPAGLARDAQGFLYVADRLNNRIQKLSASGEPLAQWGSEGTGPGQFRVPSGVAVDGAGNIYVVDKLNYRVQKLSPSGELLAIWGSKGTAPGQFDTLADGDGPNGVAVDKQGYVYVADTGLHRIQKLSPSGDPVAVWGQKGRDPGEFNWPVDVALDSQSNLYITDTGNRRIQKLSPSGEPLAIWGAKGSGPGLFSSPQRLTVDGQGNIYVSDYDLDRIHKFIPSQLPY